MAEPTRPAGDPEDVSRAADEPGDVPPTTRRGDRDGLLQPPTDDELAATGEPSADEIHAAASGSGARPAAAEDRATATSDDRSSDAVATRPAVAADTAREASPEHRDDADRTTASTAAPTASTAAASGTAPAPVTPPAQQPVLAPADDSAPPPPRRGGNRLVATAWVLLAAGLFQLLYFGALALIIVLLSGPNAVAPGLTNISRFPFAWLPVLFFFLFFELTVLLLNRAGRFAYVVASLVVGFIVYVASVLLISILVGGGIGDTPTLARAFESPEFVLTGLVAREVMLWTGFAIGARGTRVRRRNKEARARYDREVADARA